MSASTKIDKAYHERMRDIKQYLRVIDVMSDYVPRSERQISLLAGQRRSSGILCNLTLQETPIMANGRPHILAEDDDGQIFLKPI